MEGAPGPLRTQDHPYGLPDLDDKGKQEVRLGTVFLARSVEMAGAVMFTENDSGITPPVSLENPPPSEVKRHLSAWYQVGPRSPPASTNETEKLGHGISNLRGSWAPSRASGSSRANALAGRDLGNSAAAAAYPDQLVDALAEKIVAHLFKMGHLEWLKQRQVEQGEGALPPTRPGQRRRRRRSYQDEV